MGGDLDCSERKTAPNTAEAAESALSDFKNSFDSSKAAIVTSGTPEQGQVAIIQTGSEIVVTTCFEEDCASDKMMSNSVSIE